MTATGTTAETDHELLNIPGVGPKAIRILRDELGVVSIVVAMTLRAVRRFTGPMTAQAMRASSGRLK